MSSITVSGVTKSFGDIVALTDVSFTVEAGVTALLGPNGAGKSTLLRIICGLAKPTQGSVLLDGVSPRRDPRVYKTVGLVPQQEALPERMTAFEFVSACAELTGVPDYLHKAEAALETVALEPRLARPLAKYSKGMSQRVKIAQALVHSPSIMLLDEPLNGLDPQQRKDMIVLFRKLGDEGICVLVSSHVLEEVERFGTRVLVIAAGKLVAEGRYQDIRALLDDKPSRVFVGCDNSALLASILIASKAVSGVRVAPKGVVVEAPDAALFRRNLMKCAMKTGVRVTEIKPLDDDLESVFRYLVAK